MTDKNIRVITRAASGALKTKDYVDFKQIEELHDQIGIDDCSTDLSLRGLPLFRGLIGPMAESKTIVRYESPEVFESLTKEWSLAKIKRRRRRPSEVAGEKKKSSVPVPKMILGNPATINTSTTTV